MRKQITALLLVLCLVVSFAGCGAKGVVLDASSTSAPVSAPVQSVAGAPVETSLPASSVPASAASAAPSSSAPPVSSSAPPVAGLAPVGVNALTGNAVPEGMLEGQRPVAVVVYNSPRSLPQRGLAAADVVVEMPVSNSETRLQAMYADYRSLPQVGPVYGTYDQFVQMGLPLDAIQVHLDKSPYASNLLAVAGEKDIDGIQLGKVAFWFDEARQLPRLSGKLNQYCWFTDAALVWNGMTYIDVLTQGPVPMLFPFTDLANFAPGTAALTVQANYNDVYYAGFTYGADVDKYFKSYNDAAHNDEDGTQLYYDNLFVLSTAIGQKFDSDLLSFDFSGGAGYYFTGGNVTEITWAKGAADAPLKIYGPDGAELGIKPGKSYIGFVPAGRENVVAWQGA